MTFNEQIEAWLKVCEAAELQWYPVSSESVAREQFMNELTPATLKAILQALERLYQTVRYYPGSRAQEALLFADDAVGVK